jgi:hypothetical protein
MTPLPIQRLVNQLLYELNCVQLPLHSRDVVLQLIKGRKQICDVFTDIDIINIS